MLWTPAVLILDSKGVERLRIEGYLPNREFRAHLEMGLARVSFTNKQWADAEQRYATVLEQFGDTTVVPAALYWRAVCHYKATSDHAHFGALAAELKRRFPTSVWALKTIPWSG